MNEGMAAGGAEARDMRHEGRDSLWPGRVTQVIDPQYFWMQMGSREGLYQFDTLQRDLHKFGVSYSWVSVEDSQQLEPEQRVLVDTGDSSGGLEMSRFKRGVITRVAGDDCVDVFYVDFGTNELTSADKICIEFPAAFTAWPTQAIRCSLAGVQPISKNWTSRGTKTFQKATTTPLIQVLLVGIQPGYYEVALYPSVEDEARSIAHHLLEEDVAMPIDSKEVPEFVRDIPAFVASMMSQGYSESTQSNGDGHTGQVSQNPTSPAVSPRSSKALSSSPPISKIQSEKYIPPGRKYRDASPAHQTGPATDSPPRSSYSVTPPQRSSYPEYSTAPSSAAQSHSQSNFGGKTSHKNLKLNTDLKTKAPVVDFFPFANVSTYPASPVSPQKSPEKPVMGPYSGYSAQPPDEARYDHLGNSRDQAKQRQEQQQCRDSVAYEKSYNSRSPTKHHQSSESYADYPPVAPYYDTEAHTDTNYTRSPGRYMEGSPSQAGHNDGYGSPDRSVSGHHPRNVERYHGSGDGRSGIQQRKPFQNVSRFAANFNNLPDENGKYPSSLDGGKDSSVTHKTAAVSMNASKENAVTSLEPSYLQSSLEKQGMYQGSVKNAVNSEQGQSKLYARSPEKYDAGRSKTSPSKSPSVRDYTLGGSSMPFYPPKPAVGDVETRTRPVTLTPPSYYEQSASQNNDNSGGNRSNYRNTSDYNGDAFYQQPSNQAGLATTSSSVRSASYDINQSTGRVPYQYNNHNASNTSSNMNKNHFKPAVSDSYGGKQRSAENNYKTSNAFDSESLDDRTTGFSNRFSHNSNSLNQTDDGNYNMNRNAAGKLNMNVQNAQTYSRQRGYGYERQKSSPDSAQIAGFNLGDLEHTQETSTDQLKQRIHAEKLQVLQEEAGDIAAEIRENAALTEMARFGGKSDDMMDYMQQVDTPDVAVFQDISNEIDYTIRQPQKEYDDLRMASVKQTRTAPDFSEQVRLESVPSSYITSIDFPTAVKEALDFSQSGDVDMGNLKSLLNDIMESVSRARAESQLYDVLLLLLARAIQDYSQYHDVIMDSIDTLSGQVDMKENLCRALKRQQELNVRVPQSKSATTTHQAFARVLGHVYIHSMSWMNSNAAIQDNILVTVEKWVVFNNRGTQIGQKDKEHLFLDCFCAFWEIASDELQKHNEGFRGRVQAEVKRKLLNEDVSREIRERLLDILLDQFTTSASPEQANAHTQTLNRTMIPSSCQVKPEMFTCDKGMETDQEWLTMLLYELGAEDTSFSMPKEQYVNLRPGGKNTYSDQPDYFSPVRSVSSSDMNTTRDSTSLNNTTRDSTSLNNTTTSVGEDSVYVTASESFMSDYAGIDHAKGGAALSDDSIRSVDQASAERTAQREGGRKVSDKEASGSGSQTAVSDGDSWNKGARGKVRSGMSESSLAARSPNKTATRSVSETKSAHGKSIVDWFDYEPEPQPGASGTQPGARGTIGTVKHDKAAESKVSKSKVSPEKMGGKSLPKSAGSDLHTSTDSSGTSNKKSKKNKKSSQAAEKRDYASNVKHEVAQDSVVQVNEDTVVSVVDNVEGRNEDLEDEEIDWWGEEEDPIPPMMYSQATGSLGLFIDTGPDVIIESESEQMMADTVVGGDVVDVEQIGISDAESGRNNPNLTDNAGELGSLATDIPLQSGTLENASPVESKHMQSTEEEMILAEGLRKIDDEYAFDSDDEDDDGDFYNFGSDVEDLGVSADVGATGQQATNAYDDNFPASDLMVPLRNADDAVNGANVNNSGVDAADGDDEYDRSYPRTNLADFIHPVAVEREEPAPMSRWVPGKRVCLKCRDENHKTENCPDGALLLH